MRCKSFGAVACLFLLAGCDRSSQLRSQVMDLSPGANVPNQTQFSFTNYWTLTMRKETVIPRYDRAKSACLSDKTLNCKLLNANATSSNNSYASYSRASLTVQLPHNQVDGFKKSLLIPLTEEAANDVALETNTIRADNVEGESVSAGEKVQQLTAYRDQLAALAKRTNLSIEDTIRLGAEISRVQGELDIAADAKIDADNRVARETVNINLEQKASGPIADVLDRASNIFIDNVANVLAFLIGVIPWLPIIGAAIFFTSWLWRFLRNRRQKNSVIAQAN